MNPKPNTLFPGLPDYVGPTSGLFSLLHHEGPLVEKTTNVLERIDYILNHKLPNEVFIRLAHIVYLAPNLVPAAAKRAPLDADYEAKRDALDADYKAKRAPLDAEIVAYIKPLIPDFRWNGRRLNFNGANNA